MRKKLLNRLKTLFSWIVPVIRQILKRLFSPFLLLTLHVRMESLSLSFPLFFVATFPIPRLQRYGENGKQCTEAD